MTIEVIVDRIDGNTVVLMTGSNKDDSMRCPINLLPRDITEGDILRVSFEIDPVATEKAREEAAVLLQELMSKK